MHGSGSSPPLAPTTCHISERHTCFTPNSIPFSSYRYLKMFEEELVLDYDEEGLRPEPEPYVPQAIPKGATQGRGSLCPLCPHKFTHVRRHVITTHLPWYASPSTACWVCGHQETAVTPALRHLMTHGSHAHGGFQSTNAAEEYVYLMNGLLQRLCQHRGVTCVQELLQQVQQRTDLQPAATTPVQQVDEELMRLFLLVNGAPPPGGFTLRPPNSVACLLHWRILAHLMVGLPLQVQRSLKSYAHRTTETGARLTSLPQSSGLWRNQVVDAHLHLNVWCRRTGCGTLQEILDQPGRGAPSEVRCVLSAAVSNFCWPAQWPNQNQRDHLAKDGRVFFTYGVHPRSAAQASMSDTSLQAYMRTLKGLVQAERVVAVGECGLDYTVSPAESAALRSRQERCFQEQLVLAGAIRRPVVIHSRDNGCGSAAKRCLALASEVLPRDHPIHRHCFTGTLEEYWAWLQAFPRCIFSISPKILGNASLQRVVRSMDLAHLTLETDAPYLADSTEFLGEIACCVARLHNVPPAVVLSATTQTARALFRL